MEREVYTAIDVIDVSIMQTVLANEDIYSEIRDDGMVGANQLYAGAIGGVKLFVENEDFDKALELVNNHIRKRKETANEKTKHNKIIEYCPTCQSSKSLNLKIIIAVIFTAVLIAAMFIYHEIYVCFGLITFLMILPFLNIGKICMNCGAWFKKVK